MPLPSHVENPSSSNDRADVRAEGLEAGVRDTSAAGLTKVLEPLAVAHGVTIDSVVWTTERGMRTLRVIIERPERDGEGAPGEAGPRGFGVTVDDCAEFSRDASAALDLVEGLEHYSLEVSSPGLDRPLRKVADFRRFRGQLAKVKLRVPAVDGQRLLRGTIEEVSEGDETSGGNAASPDELGAPGREARITMLVDGKFHEVAWSSIESAQLSFELQSQRKPNEKGKPNTKGKQPHRSTGSHGANASSHANGNGASRDARSATPGPGKKASGKKAPHRPGGRAR